MYPVVHKIKNKDKETSKSLKNEQKNACMLLDSNPHVLSAKTLDYPLGYRGIVFTFIQISNCTTIYSALFYEDSRRLSKRSLNIHMSRVNFDRQ